MADTSARLLRLLSLLQTRRDWSGSELADRLGVGPRTVRRDIDRLRQLGYPVDADRGTAGGYRLGAGAELPPLLLDDDEAVAIAIGLRSSAAGGVTGIEESSVRALAKLEQILPSRVRRKVSTISKYTVNLTGGGPEIDAELLSLLSSACRDRDRLRFGYLTADGTASRRKVEPLLLAHRSGRWYLLAWDEDREDWRTFRVDRISGAPVAVGRFPRRHEPDGGAEAYLARMVSAARPAGPTSVVRITAPLALVSRRISSAYAESTADGDHATLLTMTTDSPQWAALHLMTAAIELGAELQWIEGEALREHFEQLAERFASTAADARPAAAEQPRGDPNRPATPEHLAITPPSTGAER